MGRRRRTSSEEAIGCLIILLVVAYLALRFWPLVGLLAVAAIITYYAKQREARARTQRWLQRVRQIDHLQAMTPRQFERFVGKVFEKAGYHVELTPGSADRGVDLFLRGKGKLAVVQCKKIKGKVGVKTVRELAGTMLHEHAEAGYIITTGEFTDPARSWARGKGITLMDGMSFLEWKEKLIPSPEEPPISASRATATPIAKAPQSHRPITFEVPKPRFKRKTIQVDFVGKTASLTIVHDSKASEERGSPQYRGHITYEGWQGEVGPYDSPNTVRALAELKFIRYLGKQRAKRQGNNPTELRQN